MIYLHSHGQRVNFWANRHGSDDGWLSATWNNRIDNNFVSDRGNVFDMLNRLFVIYQGRQIILYTSNTGC